MKSLFDIEDISFFYSSKKEGHVNTITSLCVYNDIFIITGGRDGMIKIWKKYKEDYKAIHTLYDHKDEIIDIFLLDNILVTVSNYKIILWSIEFDTEIVNITKKEVVYIEEEINCVFQNKHTIFLGTKKGKIIYFNINNTTQKTIIESINKYRAITNIYVDDKIYFTDSKGKMYYLNLDYSSNKNSKKLSIYSNKITKMFYLNGDFYLINENNLITIVDKKFFTIKSSPRKLDKIKDERILGLYCCIKINKKNNNIIVTNQAIYSFFIDSKNFQLNQIYSFSEKIYSCKFLENKKIFLIQYSNINLIDINNDTFELKKEIIKRKLPIFTSFCVFNENKKNFLIGTLKGEIYLYKNENLNLVNTPKCLGVINQIINYNNIIITYGENRTDSWLNIYEILSNGSFKLKNEFLYKNKKPILKKINNKIFLLDSYEISKLDDNGEFKIIDSFNENITNFKYINDTKFYVLENNVLIKNNNIEMRFSTNYTIVDISSFFKKLSNSEKVYICCLLTKDNNILIYEINLNKDEKIFKISLEFNDEIIKMIEYEKNNNFYLIIITINNIIFYEINESKEVLNLKTIITIRDLQIFDDTFFILSREGDFFYFKLSLENKGFILKERFVKTLIIGDSGVGKTTIACHLEINSTSVNRDCNIISSTEAMRMFTFNIKKDELNYIFELWDFGGQPGYQISHKQSFDKTKVIFFVIDLSRKYVGANSIEYWINSIIEHLQEMNDEIYLFVIGTKKDDEKQLKNKILRICKLLGKNSKIEIYTKKNFENKEKIKTVDIKYRDKTIKIINYLFDIVDKENINNIKKILQLIKIEGTSAVLNSDVEMMKKIICLKNYYAILRKEELKDLLKDFDETVFDRVMSKNHYIFEAGFIEEIE